MESSEVLADDLLLRHKYVCIITGPKVLQTTDIPTHAKLKAKNKRFGISQIVFSEKLNYRDAVLPLHYVALKLGVTL